MSDSVTPWPAAHILYYLLEFALTQVYWVNDAIQPSHPLSPPSPSALYLSQHRVFSNELAVDIRWPKYWSLSISLSSEYSGLIFFRINWFDLLAIQQTLENLLQHYNLKSSILQHSANSHIHTWLLEKP